MLATGRKTIGDRIPTSNPSGKRFVKASEMGDRLSNLTARLSGRLCTLKHN
ncbi:hypothetical protein [Merismopedia glauca]|uniref:hypothetical protein n=1 Tax=Merismopedia glauca TaxID=292586 RepID=UPI0030DB692F